MSEDDWDFERALAEHEQARSEGMEPFDPTGPIPRWEALRQLNALERQYAKGDGFALLLAIRICANHDLVIPRWAAMAFIKGVNAVLDCQTDSWDVAFGRPYPTGMHLAKARRRRELRFAIYARNSELVVANPERPIDEGLFEAVGDEFDIGKTLCGKLYYQAVRLTGLPPKS